MLKKHSISSKTSKGKRLILEARTRSFSVTNKLMHELHTEGHLEDEGSHEVNQIHSQHMEERNSTHFSVLDVQEDTSRAEIPIPFVRESTLNNIQESMPTEIDKEVEVLGTSQLEEVHSECKPFDYGFEEREFILWLSREKRIKRTACKNYTQIIRVFHDIIDPEDYLRCAFENEACTTVARKYWSLYYFIEFLQIKSGKQIHYLKEMNYYKVPQ